MMKRQHRVLSDAEFLTIVNDDDFLCVTIRGHQAIDDALNAAISQALLEPHALEIERLTFALKIDLAVALRVIGIESRSLFVILNRVRNRFAHRADAGFDSQHATELRNSFPLTQRAGLEQELAQLSPKELLRRGIAIAFLEVRIAFHGLRTAQVELEVMHELVEETLGPRRREDDHLADVSKRIAERVSRKKVERGW
jgi:hypothetical protein